MSQYYWIAWLVAFVAGEGYALYKHKGTFSEYVWKWFAVVKVKQPVDGVTRTRRFMLLAILLWIAVHFISHGTWA